MILLLLLLLWKVTHGESCLNASLCVSNGRNEECHFTRIVHQLSHFPESAKGCQTVNVQLTSGTHILNATLEFNKNVQNIKIHGAHNGRPSVIACLWRTGIRFSEKKYDKKVHIIDIVFKDCSREEKATLYFAYASYALENVVVENSEEHGLHSHHCNHQQIQNCTFRNNSKGHIYVKFGKSCKKLKSENLLTIRDNDFFEGNYGMKVTSQTDCHYKLSIAGCNFNRPAQNHILIESKDTLKHPVIVSIENSTFSESRGTNHYGVDLKSLNDNNNNMSLNIQNSCFMRNRNGSLRVFRAQNVVIEDCEFFNNDGTAVAMESVFKSSKHSTDISLKRNSFINNKNGALAVHSAGGGILVIEECEISDNRGVAVFISAGKRKQELSNIITNSRFRNNSRALYIRLDANARQKIFTHFYGCIFQMNNLSRSLAPVTSAVTIEHGGEVNRIIITASQFENNFGTDGDCSCLDIANSNDVTLNNVLLRDNHCTAIKLRASSITIEKWLNVTGNSGKLAGALRMLRSNSTISRQFSAVALSNDAKLNLVRNTAEFYGGGINSDETCQIRKKKRSCFFQTNCTVSSNDSAIMMMGNWAGRGGDAIFGGCLSECYIQGELINITDPKNAIYDNFITLQDNPSASIYAENPEQIAFCSNDSSFIAECASSHRMNVYRGEVFHVSLMVTGSTCFPTVAFMQAKLIEIEKAELEDLDGRESYKKSSKYCDTYTYAVNADLNISTVTMELLIHRETPSSFAPTLLTLVLDDCPIGYQYNSTGRKCECGDLLKSKHIRCIASTQSLEVPPLTWIGEISGRPAVSEHCQYCHIEGDTTIKSVKDANKLCTRYRKGILCGQCSGNSSLLLGGHRCGNCHNSLHKGILLMVGFAMIGVVLVLLILWLNLTVSTGLINGLIFYSNILYANHDIFFPTNQETSLGMLVSLLSTFHAWMNLDFGISVCFFDGYDTYTSTWMQFVFPFYIWFLILVLVLASRYSSRISRMTTSNTVSVLATLLLLSYSKLLTTSIAAVSFTDVTFLNDSSKHRVWILDGTILYLHGKHIPLFFMSLLVILIYILPFTLLILLVPILQTKSHYRLLKWVRSVRPLLRDFYRPYRQGYKYWPGILLLSRLLTLTISSYFSLAVNRIDLVAVSSATTVLLAIWIALGKNHITTSHYAYKVSTKYLDLFFLANLGTFTVASIYVTNFTDKQVQNQQWLTVVMVGSVIVLFSSILVYQTGHISCIRSIMRKLLHQTRMQMPRKAGQRDENAIAQFLQSTADFRSTMITHSSIMLGEVAEEQ